MAEVAIAVIDGVRDKLRLPDLRRLAQSGGIGSQIDTWERKLVEITVALADAGKKHVDEAFRVWLIGLQDLAYNIDDVIDDLEYYASTNTSSNSKVPKLMPLCTNFSPRNFRYGRQMRSKLEEISAKLNGYSVESKNSLDLYAHVITSNRNRNEETLSVDHIHMHELELVGREGVKEALLEQLLEKEECGPTVTIVSIVGMPGIGKTALASVLYEQDKVKDNFEVRAWVCMSGVFDDFTISKAILRAVCGKKEIISDPDLLHSAVKEKLSNKRFLLVLDDVSSWYGWHNLLRPLLVGAFGSKIILTTCNTEVASMMDSHELHHLDVLSSEDAMSLLAQHALGEKNLDKYPTLKAYSEGIVKKCGGLPLALRMCGRLLKSIGNVEDWIKFNNEMWEEEIGRGIHASLRRSYCKLYSWYMEPFVYCSLMPKDYVFNKNELVLMWMAQGYLPQSRTNKSMEHLGHQYFQELESRSLIQHSTTHELGYTLHGLVSDSATRVTKPFFFTLDDGMDMSNTNETFEKLRHFSVGQRCGSYRNLKLTLTRLQEATNLRTFLLPMSLGYAGLLDNLLVELLPKLRLLRVLSVANQEITKAPESIGSLKHLRYLNFSHTAITCLPEQVGDLYNLQSLLLRSCYHLSSLPPSFENLINLRHLDISDTPNLNKMPVGIGRSTALRTLPKVIIEGANGFKISELKGLLDLQGELSIIGLDKVIDPIQAKDSNLHQKEGLDVLELKWSNVFDDSRNEIVEYEVLKQLRPHPNLRNLKILFYKGTRFPSWVGHPSFACLTELTLCGCKSTHLPTLGQLLSLRKLFVEKMNEVTAVGSEFLESTNYGHPFLFSDLQVLKFDDMRGWERWSLRGRGDRLNHVSFRNLHEISFRRCPKLAEVSVGLIPSLEVLQLHIEECSEAVLRSMVGVASSLIRLEMLNVKGLTQLHVEHLKYLWELYVSECHELIYLGVPVNLRKLEVLNCKKIASLGEIEVKEVTFLNCDSLESYTCPNGVEKLVIGWCRSMTSLTLHEHNRSLKEVSINDCPSMDYAFPCGSWPPNLKKLKIGGLRKPMSEWGVQNFPTSLVELDIYGVNSGVDSFAVAKEASATASSTFILPTSLTCLSLDGFADVESISEVLKQLPCLKRLDIWSCPKLRDLPADSSSLTVRVWQ